MLREPFQERWQDLPGGGCNYVSQDQGWAADVSCAYDRITASESESILLDKTFSLMECFMVQISLVPA